MTLIYTVHSVSEAPVQREIELDGETVTASVPGLSVELTSPHGTIFLNLSGPQAVGHSFTMGQEVPVTFGEA